ALESLRARALGFEIAAGGQLGGQSVGSRPVRLPAFAVAHNAEAAIEHGAIFETLLIAEIGKPGEDVVIVGGLLRRDGRNAFVGRVIVVEEQSCAEAVARSKILLELEEIAAADEVIGVGVGGKLGDVDVAVLRVDGFEEPGFVADDGAGKGETRLESVEANAVLIAEGRDKVGSVVAKLVVAHA